MAKGAAKEDKLAELHCIVAQVLATQVGERVEEEQEDGTAVELYTATPALLTCAMKFLKDNEITCMREVGDNISKLEEALRAKRTGHGNVIQIKPEDDGYAVG